MKLVSTLAVFCALFSAARANVPNPFTNTFRGGIASVTANVGGSGLPNFTSTNQVVAQQPVLTQQVSNTSITIPTAPAPAPAVAAPIPTTHSHPTPNLPPPAPPAPMVSHSHGPRTPLPPMQQPGFPHVHSGHPYIAPAVAPQRMTYQQIIEYLTNSGGLSLTSMLSNGSGNFLLQCKAYCDTLPPSPVCDSTNVLYRNECEAKCVNKTASTTNLRYGICCCGDDDFAYETSANKYYTNTTNQNFCVSICILNCLGGQSSVETQHSSDSVVISRSSGGCKAIN